MKRQCKAALAQSAHAKPVLTGRRNQAHIPVTVPGGLINNGIALVIQGERVVCRGSRLDAVRWLIDARSSAAGDCARFEYAEIMDC